MDQKMRAVSCLLHADVYVICPEMKLTVAVPAQEVLDLAEEPSQFVPADVPEAFKPESLALIESQCRNFLRWASSMTWTCVMRVRMS